MDNFFFYHFYLNESLIVKLTFYTRARVGYEMVTNEAHIYGPRRVAIINHYYFNKLNLFKHRAQNKILKILTR